MCGFEVSDLTSIHDEYSKKGVTFLAILFDKNTQDDPADLPFAKDYAVAHGIQFRTGIDPQRFNTYKYFDINATPYTMVVKKDGMVIRTALMGWDSGGDGEKTMLTDLLDTILSE